MIGGIRIRSDGGGAGGALAVDDRDLELLAGFAVRADAAVVEKGAILWEFNRGWAAVMHVDCVILCAFFELLLVNLYHTVHSCPVWKHCIFSPILDQHHPCLNQILIDSICSKFSYYFFLFLLDAIHNSKAQTQVMRNPNHFKWFIIFLSGPRRNHKTIIQETIAFSN